MSVSLPKDYLGKDVHCLFYIEEEAQDIAPVKASGKKPSDFFGILSEPEGEKFDQHVKQIRTEWDRDI